MDNQAKLLELIKDEKFMQELLEKNSAEEAQAYFEENGVSLTIQEVEELGTVLEKIANGEISQEVMEQVANGELSEAELEEVAGGSELLTGLVVGTLVGGTVGTGIVVSIAKWRW